MSDYKKCGITTRLIKKRNKLELGSLSREAPKLSVLGDMPGPAYYPYVPAPGWQPNSPFWATCPEWVGWRGDLNLRTGTP